MPKDLVFVLKWVKNPAGCLLYWFHLSGWSKEKIEFCFPPKSVELLKMRSHWSRSNLLTSLSLSLSLSRLVQVLDLPTSVDDVSRKPLAERWWRHKQLLWVSRGREREREREREQPSAYQRNFANKKFGIQEREEQEVSSAENVFSPKYCRVRSCECWMYCLHRL